MRRSAVLLLLAVLLPAVLASPVLGHDPDLAADTEVSDTGYYRLSWTAPDDGGPVTVQESETADFAGADTIYEGPDAATVVSGRLDGAYYYRIRAGRGPWSDPVTVTVRHHSLAQAFSILGLGAVVFLATAALVVGGHRRHRREMAAQAAAGDAPDDEGAP